MSPCASQIANFMMLVPNGEVNALGGSAASPRHRPRLNGVDVNALYVPQWAQSWSLRTALSYVDSRDREGRVA